MLKHKLKQFNKILHIINNQDIRKFFGCPLGFVRISFSSFFFFFVRIFFFLFIFFFSLQFLHLSLQPNAQGYHFQVFCIHFRGKGHNFLKTNLGHPPSCFQDGRHPCIKFVCSLSPNCFHSLSPNFVQSFILLMARSLLILGIIDKKTWPPGTIL